MKTQLIDALRSAGKEVFELRLKNGSEIMVLPYGGRILGLFAGGDERNFLWTNPALENATTAREYYARGGWPNSGGERIWLAPEIDFFLPDFPALTSYYQPPALDPGSYRVTVADKELEMAMELSLTPKSTGQPVRLRLSKVVRSAAAPLVVPEGIQYAGYEMQATLEGLSPFQSGIGMWSLLQMPFGGEMFIPTYGASRPLVVFGKSTEDYISVTDRAIRFQMNAPGDHKISVRAHACTGRVGYVYDTGDARHLIVRNFLVNPSGEYVDACWNDASDRGYCVQACSANGAFGQFSELEYHVPAMTPETPWSRDVSQVWTYRGSPVQIGKIARELLGVLI